MKGRAMKGHVKLRLARWGCSKNNFFGIVAAPLRNPRDGKHLERLGTYNPIPYQEHNFEKGIKVGTKHVELKIDRIKYWLGVGAEPTSRVSWLLAKAGLVPDTPKQRQNQGLISISDSRYWDVRVIDKDTKTVVGCISADEARKYLSDKVNN